MSQKSFLKRAQKTLIESATSLREGRTLKDKLILATYFAKYPIYAIYALAGKPHNHKLSGEVYLSNKNGEWYCANNVLMVYTASTAPEGSKVHENLNLDSGVFVDIGANIGKYTIQTAKKLGNKGKVIAIEAAPTNFEVLRKNIELNKLKNVLPINTACYSKNTTLKFYLTGGHGGHSLLKLNDRPVLKEIPIKAQKLDSILARRGITKVGLIKIDVEGAEAEVVKGAIQTIKKSKPRIIAEAYDNQHLEKLNKILAPLGYTSTQIDPINYLFRPPAR